MILSFLLHQARLPRALLLINLGTLLYTKLVVVGHSRSHYIYQLKERLGAKRARSNRSVATSQAAG